MKLTADHVRVAVETPRELGDFMAQARKFSAFLSIVGSREALHREPLEYLNDAKRLIDKALDILTNVDPFLRSE